MSVQHQGPCAVSIRELWQQIEEMKATIAELKTTLRDDRVSVNEQIDTVVDELEREGRRRVSLSSRLSKQAFKVAQVQIMNEYQGIRHARFTTTEVPARLPARLRGGSRPRMPCHVQFAHAVLLPFWEGYVWTPPR